MQTITALQNIFINKINYLLTITCVPKNWTYIEHYMKINGEKINISKPLNKRVAKENSSYHNGFVLQRKNDIHMRSMYMYMESYF